MKKYLKVLLTACLALCMVLCLGLAVACQTNDQPDTFTITVLNEDGTPAQKPAAGPLLQYCAEDAACHMANPDANGKVEVDITTDEWKNSPTIHVEVFKSKLPEGHKVYDESGKVCDFNTLDQAYEVYVDHHTVKGVTLTIKKDSDDGNGDDGNSGDVKAEDIDTGCLYDIRDFVNGKPKAYATILDKNTHGGILDVDVNGGEFDLSVLVGESKTPVKTTLNSTNTSFKIENDNTSTYGTSVKLTITPKTAGSTHLTFTLCPIYELGEEGAILNASKLDVYKVYLVLEENAELSFSNPFGAAIDNADNGLSGFPITLTIGKDKPVVWEKAADIQPISTTQSGAVPFTFEFGDPDNANLYLRVKNANATSSNTPIVVDVPETITLSDDSDSAVYTFTVSTAGAYVILVEGAANAVVQYSVGSSQSNRFSASKNDGSLAVAITYYEIKANPDNPIDFEVIKHETLSVGDVVEIIFSTDKTSEDSYTAKVTADTGYTHSKSDEELAPEEPEYEYINLDEKFGGEFEADGEGYYWLSIMDFGDGIPEKLTLTIDDIDGEFELSYKIGENEVQTKTISATGSYELDLSNEEVTFMGIDIIITLKTANGGTIHITISKAE